MCVYNGAAVQTTNFVALKINTIAHTHTHSHTHIHVHTHKHMLERTRTYILAYLSVIPKFFFCILKNIFYAKIMPLK